MTELISTEATHAATLEGVSRPLAMEQHELAKADARLAAVAAVLDEWAKPADAVKVETYMQLGVKVGIDAAIDDILADIRAALADPAVEVAAEQGEKS